jgi:pimeloyl-ACP methyl ester carboxylesterase
MFRRGFTLGLVLFLVPCTLLAQVERGPNLPRKASLGAQLASTNKEKAALLGVKEGSVEIVRVIPATTAEALGLKAGDIVLSLNGKKTPTVADLMAEVRNINGGANTKISVLRDKKTVDLAGIAVEKPRQKGDGSIVVEYDQVVSLGKRIRIIGTHPKGPGPFPTIFWIGGIGAYSLDGEYNGISYGNIMGPLSKDYAIIRMDKPGQGDSEGPIYADLEFNTELDAYLQAVKLTKTLNYVDKNKIAIVGHSMGGVFGPLVAAQEKVAGLAVSGTIGKTWVEYILENTRRQSMLAGAKADDVDRSMVELSAVAQHLFYEDISPKDIKKKYPKLTNAVNAQTPDGKTYSGVGLKFWQQLAKRNMPEAWSKVDAKSLILWGSSDFISTRSDHELLADFMNQRKPGSAELVIVPDSDHGFLNTKSMKESQEKWGRGGAAFNPNILQILGDWLKKTLN